MVTKKDTTTGIDPELQAVLDRMQKADTDVDAFPEWDFKKNPVLQGKVTKVKTTTQIRRGEEVDVRIAIIDTAKETITLWESANLGEFFDCIHSECDIVVIFKGYEDLKGAKRMKVYDAYWS